MRTARTPAKGTSPTTQGTHLSPAASHRIRNEIILKNMGLVHAVAFKFGWAGMPHEDLVQEGVIGLAIAAQKFDPSRGTKFSSVAVPWIRAMISRSLEKDAVAISVPIRVTNLLHSIKNATQEIVGRTGNQPTIQELIEHLGVPESAIKLAMFAKSHASSLDQETLSDKAGSTFFRDRFADQTEFGTSTYVEVESELHAAEARMKEFMEVLETHPKISPRNCSVFKVRYGLEDGGQPAPFRQVASEFTMSHERIRQIIEGVWIHLRRKRVAMTHAVLLQESVRLQGLREVIASVRP